MIILKLIGKIIAIPLLVVTSLIWLVVKTMIALYGLCYGLLGIGVISAMILFLAYQEWANVIECNCANCDCCCSICSIVCRYLHSGAFGRSKHRFTKNY